MIQRFAIPCLLFVSLLTWSQVSSGAILARTDTTIPVGTGGPAYADNITFDSATKLEWLDFTWTPPAFYWRSLLALLVPGQAASARAA